MINRSIFRASGTRYRLSCLDNQNPIIIQLQQLAFKHLNIWRHKFVENHKFVEVWKIVTLMPQICDSSATKLWRYTKKVHNFVAVESQICGIRVTIFHTSTNLWFSTNLCRQMLGTKKDESSDA